MSEAVKYITYNDTGTINDELRSALLMSAQAGDEEAMERSITANRGLVKKCLFQITNKYGNIVDKDDLFQEGMVGLHKAILTYCPEKARFSTHAMNWIFHYMMRYIENNSRTVRVPSHTNATFMNIVKYQREYYQDNGKYPTDTQIMEACNLKAYEMTAYHQFGTEILSLNDPAVSRNDRDRLGSGRRGEYKKINERMSMSADRSIASPEDIVVENEKSSSMSSVLDTLTPMDKEIVLMRFGFAPYEEPVTLKEIAKKLGTTSTTIRNHLEKITVYLQNNADFIALA